MMTVCIYINRYRLRDQGAGLVVLGSCIALCVGKVSSRQRACQVRRGTRGAAHAGVRNQLLSRPHDEGAR